LLSTTSRSPTRCRNTTFQWGSRTYIMGIINATPDSFSGDGLGGDIEAAVAQALRFVDEGADILDIGGESTRPRHTPISADEEIARVIPVLSAVRAVVDIPISIDTYKSQVAAAALDAGADMINDIWGLKRDPALARLAAQWGVPIVLMHNQQGTEYENLLADIIVSLHESCLTALAMGVPPEQIIIDPGIGFGKNWGQNLVILRRLHMLTTLGYPMLLGASRKSTIGRILGDLPPDQRVEGTAATVALGIAGGTDIVRVHDVQAMVRVARMTDAIVRGDASA